VKLYRAKVPTIAREALDQLIREGDIDVAAEDRDEAEKDLVAIMDEYLRRDNDLRDRIRDEMAALNLPYNEFGKTRKRLAEEMGHPVGDEVERFIARQIIENMLISRYVSEVFSDDKALFKKLILALRAHDVDERQIREEAESRVKNLREGTVEYEIALAAAVKDVKKRRGLI
jgi:hypothetical protein